MTQTDYATLLKARNERQPGLSGRGGQDRIELGFVVMLALLFVTLIVLLVM